MSSSRQEQPAVPAQQRLAEPWAVPWQHEWLSTGLPAQQVRACRQQAFSATGRCWFSASPPHEPAIAQEHDPAVKGWTEVIAATSQIRDLNAKFLMLYTSSLVPIARDSSTIRSRRPVSAVKRGNLKGRYQGDRYLCHVGPAWYSPLAPLPMSSRIFAQRPIQHNFMKRLSPRMSML